MRVLPMLCSGGIAVSRRISRAGKCQPGTVKTHPRPRRHAYHHRCLKGYDEALREVHRRAESDPKRYFYADQYSIPVTGGRTTTALPWKFWRRLAGRSPILSVASAREGPLLGLAND